MASYGGELPECWFLPKDPRDTLGDAEDWSLPYKMLVVFSVFLYFFLCGRPPSQLTHLAAAAHPGTEG